MKRPPVSRFFDPICGMWLDAVEVTITFTYIGWTYAFCSEECRNLFAQKPDVHVIRLAQDPEAHIAHCCPKQRGSDGGQAASGDGATEGIGRELNGGD
jgi:YHS domain-containing protein